MQSANMLILMTQEQLRCPICMDVFTEPVTIPCGHNFCKNCIARNWRAVPVCSCPYCRKSFPQRPLAGSANTFISGVVSEFRRSLQLPPAGPDEVPCDICVGLKPKAAKKSCPTCLCSYCEAHLEPHRRVEALKQHRLAEPTRKLEGLCKEHLRPLELYCQTERACVCRACAESNCGSHCTLPLEEGLEAEAQRMIRERRTWIQRNEKDQGKGVAESGRFLSALTALRQEVRRMHGAELKKIKEYAVDVTLDRDTAHPWLRVYDNGKRVSEAEPKNPPAMSGKRFTDSHGVLGKESISSGKIYYEVQVLGKTEWDLGVARESIKMTGKIKPSPDLGFWAICRRGGGPYRALDKPGVDLPVEHELQKVGVFVDYEEGLVSFYDVQAGVHLYAFTGCNFTEKLNPYFFMSGNQNKTNNTSLLISPVDSPQDYNTAEKCTQAIADPASFLKEHKTTERQKTGLLEWQAAESASMHLLMTQEQLRCTICMDVFTEPVTIPCGHNFCKNCIASNWASIIQGYSCPHCNMAFSGKQLVGSTNTFISGIVSEFRRSQQRPPAKPDKVPCDICVGFKPKAAKKSCLVCMCSYCEAHLEPHGRVEALKQHRLVRPTRNLEGLCKKGVAESVRLLSALTVLRQEVRRIHGDELMRIKEYAMDVTLDPDTAHPWLCVHHNGKRASEAGPKNPPAMSGKRFTASHGVLGKESISSGRIYYEVQVLGKTDWDLGVARESIKMTGKIKPSPDLGFWAIWRRDGVQYRALDEPVVHLPVGRRVQKVGVFVDYEEGRVSFYDVQARVHLYTFTNCNFKEKLYPYFRMSGNYNERNGALFILPVGTTDPVIRILASTAGCIMADDVVSPQSHHGGAVGVSVPQLEKIMDQEIARCKLKLREKMDLLLKNQ